jgi:hypothetical protein
MSDSANAARQALLLSGDLKALNEAFEENIISAQEYSTALHGMSDVEKAAISGVQTFTTVITAWRTAFNAAADLAAGNIDELVGLYNAQINAISAQNKYTQALALQATATNIYGKGSEEATRATTAASYVGALYTQSKKNEMVALNNYLTATAANMATVATSITQVITALNSFQLALGAVALEAADSSAQMALAAIPIIGGIAALGFGLYQAATTPRLTPPTSYQSGGYVPKTGLAMLHQGETVIPKSEVGGGGGGMGNVEIHIHATSNVDLARVRQEVETALAQALLHAGKQRGVYA